MLQVGRFLLFHDLTIDKVQVTIRIHSDRTSPNPPNSPDPDCDPSVRESMWTQWPKPCKIPHFSLTERTYLTQNAPYHEPIATGSHEVSGSIPLISTKTKSHSVRNGFFVLAGHTWREKRCGSTECIFAAQKRRFFCMQCRKHKKMQSARSKRSLRSIPLIVPLSFLEKRPHFFSHAT